ncbi:ABC transporter ATP-binding protein [Martelella alba]|uniref:ABC transporter ATP-binding protein n=1 Tax=Martelella alba TaxID=2590451 RepID=A0A506U5V9_9HYPH|nr:ABC transporter ATP-binding protein [Martelella alba]TPW29240.1 ABC transporter ATP-binding protein [Martelella alba]
MSDIHLDNIRKSYGRTEVLHGISLELASGEFVSLLGASGCGKTTLLRSVAGLESVTAGRIVIDGQDVTQLPPERRDIAMMFQSYALLPHLSVSENVRFPLRMRRIGNREEQAERVKAALETVQLSHLSERLPRQLSGGQQQRVALARAIVSNPKVLLLDEPLSNLDARLREDMQVELIEIHRRLGLTTLFVTHDQEEALSLSDRVVLLNAGTVEQEGAPAEIYAEPATAFVSGFLGSANILPARLGADGTAKLTDGQIVAIPPTSLTGDVQLVLRQEDLSLATKGNGLAATVRTRVFLGARNRYVLELAGKTIRLLTGNEIILEPGASVTLQIDADRIRVLDR